MLQERDERKDDQINTEDIIIEIEQIIAKNEEMVIERMLVDIKIGTKKARNDGAKKTQRRNSYRFY